MNTESFTELREKKQEMIQALRDGVPDGYYAIERKGSDISFIRITTIKNRRKKTGEIIYSQYPEGSWKIQTKHGDSLILRIVILPNGRWRYFCHSGVVQDLLSDLMAIVANWQDATQRYASELGKCGRCSADLTDAESRRLGVGPECVKHWPWVYDLAELRDEM